MEREIANVISPAFQENFRPAGDPLADRTQRLTPIVALLTARGGSNLPHKNLRLVKDKPVLAWPLIAANEVIAEGYRFASSDDEDILTAANEYGYLPILRPEAISGPEALHIDAVRHAISYMEIHYEVRPAILVVLMGNSVCVLREWLEDCINRLICQPELTAVIPVVEDNDHHPWRAKTVRHGLLSSFVDFTGIPVSTNRQDLSPCYFIAQNFWVIRMPLPEQGEAPWTFLGDKVQPYVVPPCPDVHEEVDLLLSERWLDTYGA